MLSQTLFAVKTATALLLCLLFAGLATPSKADSLPVVTFSLSDEKIVAGEPLFLNYTISNKSASTLQVIWANQNGQWLEARIVDSRNKDVSPVTTSPLTFYDTLSGYISPRRYEPASDTPIPLSLHPGQSFTSKMPLTAAAAALSKTGVYHVEVGLLYRSLNTKDAQEVSALSPRLQESLVSKGTISVSKEELPRTLPSTMLAVERTKSLRLVVTSVDAKDLTKRAAQLSNMAATGSGAEGRLAMEKLSAWPSSSAVETWQTYVRMDKQESERLGRTPSGNIHHFILSIIENRNPALIPFLVDLTWKSHSYDAHRTFERLYVNGDDVTKKKILQIYTDHHEEFPEHPVNY